MAKTTAMGEILSEKINGPGKPTLWRWYDTGIHSSGCQHDHEAAFTRAFLAEAKSIRHEANATKTVKAFERWLADRETRARDARWKASLKAERSKVRYTDAHQIESRQLRGLNHAIAAVQQGMMHITPRSVEAVCNMMNGWISDLEAWALEPFDEDHYPPDTKEFLRGMGATV